MKKRILLIICSLFVFLGTFTYPNAEEEPPYFNGESVVIIDANSKRVLYEKNGDTKQYPASTTKVMTMLLAIEKGDLDKTLTMSEYASLSIEYGSSHISLMPGETITLKQAVLAASIASANDACNGIAEAVAPSNEAFIEMMNERAKEIGCTNTHFANAHGLHDEEHYTTATDLAKMMSEACQNQTFVELTSVLDTTIEPTNITTETRYLYNQKECLEEDSEYYIPELVTAKSGYTDQSRNCYVAYGVKGNVNIVVAVMNADGRCACYEDLKTAFDYAFKNYSSFDDVNRLQRKTHVPHGLLSVGGKVELEKDFAIPAYATDEENTKDFKVEYKYLENATDKKVDEVVGTCNLYYQDTLLQSRSLILKTEVKSIFSLILSWLFTILKFLAILAILAVLGLILAKKIYQKYRRYKRRQQRR